LPSFDYTSALFLSGSFHTSESTGFSISGGFRSGRGILPPDGYVSIGLYKNSIRQIAILDGGWPIAYTAAF